MNTQQRDITNISSIQVGFSSVIALLSIFDRRLDSEKPLKILCGQSEDKTNDHDYYQWPQTQLYMASFVKYIESNLPSCHNSF